ncbi:MAG: hypothetical protein KGD73_08245 [Candidatus Lokiarchaeota archaeon]|nr:hypothetical protein [Candidatus Lokiarchaeota archaeon]
MEPQSLQGTTTGHDSFPIRPVLILISFTIFYKSPSSLDIKTILKIIRLEVV